MSNQTPDLNLWKCPNCGQVHFGDHPPDMCAFCQDFTTWLVLVGNEFILPQHPRHNVSQPPPSEDHSLPDDDDVSSTLQLPLFGE